MNAVARLWSTRLSVTLLAAAASLAFPKANWWWLGWVGFVPILLLVARSPTRREAMIRSWMAGAGFLTALHYWLIPFMGMLTVPVAAVMGLFWLPLGLAVWSFLRPGVERWRHLAGLVVVPAVWVVIEWARSWEYLGGSWGLWGLTQWRIGPVIQAAALGGVWLLSFLLLAVNVALAQALMARGAQRRAAVAVAVAIPLLMTVGGALRGDPAVSGSVRIAGVQPGAFDSPQERFDGHLALTASLEPSTFDVVVWGQSSVSLDPFADPEVDEALRSAAARAGTDLFVNVDIRAGDRTTKSTMQYTPDGPVATYDKRRLVPFGEFVPLRGLFGWVSGVTQAAEEDRARGDEATTMTSAGVEIGPLISYESTFPDLRRELAVLEADLTVVQGASWTFQGSWAQPQQASYEAIRAVESGRSAVLVSVSGTSAAFDARGRRLAWVPADQEVAFVVEVPLSQEKTPYVRFGDWVVWLSFGVAAVAAATLLVRRLRSSEPATFG
ncbi:MAG: apolipoprotein N-acyltransferase [Acidimicrobiia bacterium]